MSIDDEIRKTKEKMENDMRKAEMERIERERLSAALSSAGLRENSPEVILPTSSVQAVIREALPSMKFTKPKIVRSMPNGKVLARQASNNERADMRSFDALLYSNGTGKGSTQQYIWVFNNGSVAFCANDNTNISWSQLKIGEDQLRTKIIEALAHQSIESEKSSSSGSSSSSSGSSSSSSGGCYIATAVYGSYDCPEVWVLRRFRDNVLQQNFFGRLFVKAYYATSPTLVKLAGSKQWFVSFWRRHLDKMVNSLKLKGYSDQEYNDQS